MQYAPIVYLYESRIPTNINQLLYLYNLFHVFLNKRILSIGVRATG